MKTLAHTEPDADQLRRRSRAFAGSSQLALATAFCAALCAVLCAFASPASAQLPSSTQTPNDTESLTRAAVLERLIATNPDVARAADAVRRARVQRQGTYGVLDPIFDASLDLRRSVTPTDTGSGQFSAISDRFALSTGIARTFAPGTRVAFSLSQALTRSEIPLRSLVGPDFEDLINAGFESDRIVNVETGMTLSVTQPLLQGFGRDNVLFGELLASRTVDARELEMRQIASARALEALTAYAELRYAAQEVALRERSLERSNEQLQITEAEQEAGQIAPIEVDLVREQVAARTEALLIARAELARRSRQLAQLLGQAAAYTGSIEPADALVVPPAVSFSPMLCDEVAAQSADIALVRSQVTLAEARTRQTAEGLRPSLDATAGLSQSGLDPNWGRSLAEALTFDAPTVFGGLVFTTPLRNRAARAEHDVAQAEVAAAEFEVIEMERTLCFQAREAAEALALLSSRAEIAQTRVGLAERALTADSERFVSGLSTVQAGIDARENLEAAEVSLLRLGVDTEIAWWQLQHLRGLIIDTVTLTAP